MLKVCQENPYLGSTRRLLLLRQCFPSPKSLPHFLGVGLGSKLSLCPLRRYMHLFVVKFSFGSFSPSLLVGNLSNTFLGTAGWKLLPVACVSLKRREHTPPTSAFISFLHLVFKHKCCGLRITRSCPCAPIPWSPLVLHFQVSDCNYTN